MNYQFRKGAFDFLFVIHITVGVFRVITKLFSILGRFRFGWDFPTGAELDDFEPLKVNFNTSDTQQAHPYAKLRLLSHTSKSVAICGLFM